MGVNLPPASSIADLAPGTREELRNFLMALADTKRALGLRYAEWCDRAPWLEAGVAASAMAQDELGQARVLYALIQQFPGAPGGLEDETRSHDFNLAYLDRPFRNWPAFVAANLLIGSAVRLTQQSLLGSRFLPLRARIPKMQEEERFHRIHALGWFKHLQASGGRLAREQGQAVEAILPETLCWFGDAQHDLLVREQIVTVDPGELRERYMEELGPLLAESGNPGPLVLNVEAKRWAYVGALPWNDYDPTTRRVRAQAGVQASA